MRCRYRWRAARTISALIAAATFLAGAFPASAARQGAAGIRAIHVWPTPSFLALDPATDEVYVRSNGTLDRYGNPVSNGAISALDGRTGRIVHVWPDKLDVPTVSWLDFIQTSNGLQAYHFPSWLEVLVPSEWGNIGDIAVDPRTDHLFGLGRGPTAADTSFLTVDIRKDLVVRQVVLPDQEPGEILGDPQSGRVILAAARNTMNSPMTVLHVFDARTGRLLATTQIPGQEVAMAVDAQANRLLVYLNGSVQLFTLDALHLLASIPIHQPYFGLFLYASLPWVPEPIAVDTGLGRGVVINQDPTDTAQVIDLRTGRVLSTVPVGQQPVAVQTDSTFHRAYIADYQSGDVAVVDLRTGTQVANVSTDTGPRALAVDAKTGEVFVANSGAGANSVTMFPANISQ